MKSMQRLDGQVNALDGETLTDKVKSQEQEIQELRNMIKALAKKKTAGEKRSGISIGSLFRHND